MERYRNDAPTVRVKTRNSSRYHNCSAGINLIFKRLTVPITSESTADFSGRFATEFHNIRFLTAIGTGLLKAEFCHHTK